MLYDLNWLQEGQTFPPRSEWERLKTYADNKALFYGDISEVLAPYRSRIQDIVNRFAVYNGWGVQTLDRFELDLNYFQLMTLKTGDLIAGEPPTITSKGGKELFKDAEKMNFNSNLLQIIYDVSRFGDGVSRLKLNAKKEKKAVIVSPNMWFPVIDREDKDEILYHVLAWAECLNPNAGEYEKKKYEVKVQVHERGQYTPMTFAVKDARVGESLQTLLTATGMNLALDSYTLGACTEAGRPIKTGYDDFAVVDFHNTVTSDSIFGLNDYDRITPILAELQVRYSLENLILDKHSAPTICAPIKALTEGTMGDWKLPIGGVIPMELGEEVPQYVTWDAAFTANHTMIEKLEKHLYSLSEMGAIVNDDAFGASQGFEALETRMTNARLKARRMSSGLTQPVKQLLSALSGVPVEDISVCWNDGLPNNEYRQTDIATKQLQGGLFDLETILMDHFDKSEEDAAQIAEKVRQGRSNSTVSFDEDAEDNLEDETQADKNKLKLKDANNGT